MDNYYNEEVRRVGKLFENITDDLKNNYDFILEAVKQNVLALGYMYP